MVGHQKTEVLVAGAGPVGLATALLLAERGIEVEIVDEQWRAAARSYALALHPSSLELLEPSGIAADLVKAGKKVDGIAFYQGRERVGSLSFAKLSSAFPFLLVLPQSALEESLAKKLEARCVRVQWNQRLAWLRPDKDKPVAEIEKLEKESSGYGIARTEWVVQGVREVEAEFVVGADGHRSIVRRDLEIPFEEVGTSETYGVFEFAADYEEDNEVRVVFDGNGTSVLWPLGEGRFRFSFPLLESEMQYRRTKSRLYVHVDDQPFPHLGLEQLDALLRARAPWFHANVTDMAWAIGIRFEHRLAKSFGLQRVWLAGDAAHLAGPVGVHSMNRGIQEGHALSKAIISVLRDRKPLRDVETCGKELRAPWEPLLGLGGAPIVDDDAPAWVKDNAQRIPGCIPASGAHLETLLSQLGMKLGNSRT